MSKLCVIRVNVLFLPKRTTDMKNIVKRSISGLIYIALIVGTLLAGANWFTALTALFAMLAVWEFHSLTDSSEDREKTMTKTIIALDIIVAIALVLSTALEPIIYLIISIIIVAFYSLLRIVLALYDRKGDALLSTFRSAMSLLYIGLPLAILSFTNHWHSTVDEKFGLVMLMFVMIWLNDTGAYCVGCTLGKHRLCERLSPKKSWEGFWGGMVFSTGAGVAYGLTIGESRGLIFWIGLGIVVSIFATWGDLFESLIKRTVGVKDSGKIMPGHGGILDRIDSLLLVAPATLIYIIISEFTTFIINTNLLNY